MKSYLSHNSFDGSDQHGVVSLNSGHGSPLLPPNSSTLNPLDNAVSTLASTLSHFSSGKSDG